MTSEFTPIASLLGGMIIGLAAVILMATNGRIAGISGIASRLLPPWDNSQSGRDLLAPAAFVIGLLLAAPATRIFSGEFPAQVMVAGIPLLVLAGLLVGFGSGYGNGCTSGHGVCGISRTSSRSIVATITFMLTAATTVYILRHIIGVAA